MNEADRHRLLHALYYAPPLKRGDRTTCKYRNRDVVITSWTDARVSWPRCRVNQHSGGHPGLRVNDELLRAIRTESEVAISYWFGVATDTAYKWRNAFGVGKGEPKALDDYIKHFRMLGQKFSEANRFLLSKLSTGATYGINAKEVETWLVRLFLLASMTHRSFLQQRFSRLIFFFNCLDAKGLVVHFAGI